MKDNLNVMADIFRALSDPTRLKLIWLLTSNQNEEFCVADLASNLGVSQPAVSQHLRVLKSIDLIEPDRRGFHIYYKINVEVLSNYKDSIDNLFERAFKKCSHNSETENS